MVKNGDGEMIKKINEFRKSEEYQFYQFGEDYYRGRNTEIMKRNPKCYVEGLGVVTNPYKANHRLASGYLQKIIDQKVNFLLGNGAVIKDESLDMDKYGLDFDEFLQDIATTASKKGRAWVYFYMDGGVLKMVEVEPEQITPTYDKYGKLEKIIRQYDDVDEKGKTVHVVLEYNKDGVREYVQERNKLDDRGYFGHYTVQRTAPNGALVSEEELGFGIIPFIELKNNPEGISDLYPIKPMIDIYDIVNSDFANNIDDMQEAYFVIKNFQGDNYDDFLNQLKQTKAVKVGEDGDVQTNQLQIPTEARQVFLNLTDRNIYKFAMAVDTTQLSGSSLTNVAIKAQFADLDLKTDKFEGEIRKFFRALVEFINNFEKKNYDDEILFNRSLVINELEVIDAVNKSAMVISRKTMLDNHPLVEDTEEELKLIEKDETNSMLRYAEG